MRPSDLIRKGWTQGAYARDENGDILQFKDRHKATCWCAAGAIGVCFPLRKDFVSYVEALQKLIPGSIIYEWNDLPDQTQENVLNTLLEVEEKFYETI